MNTQISSDTSLEHYIEIAYLKGCIDIVEKISSDSKLPANVILYLKNYHILLLEELNNKIINTTDNE